MYLTSVLEVQYQQICLHNGDNEVVRCANKRMRPSDHIVCDYTLILSPTKHHFTKEQLLQQWVESQLTAFQNLPPILTFVSMDGRDFGHNWKLSASGDSVRNINNPLPWTNYPNRIISDENACYGHVVAFVPQTDFCITPFENILHITFMSSALQCFVYHDNIWQSSKLRITIAFGSRWVIRTCDDIRWQANLL